MRPLALPARGVIWGKALAALRGSLGITALLSAPYILFVFPRGMEGSVAAWEIFRVPIYGLILLLTAACITFAGIWISLKARNSLRAIFITYSLVALITVLPVIGFRLIEPFTEFEYAQFTWITLPSPIAALISAGAVEESGNILHLDTAGGFPIWTWFVLFWGAVLPCLVLGCTHAYRNQSKG